LHGTATQREFVEERSRLDKELANSKTDLQAVKARLKMEKTHFATLQISDALAEQVCTILVVDRRVKGFAL
jgi:hypothetical protein